MDQLALEKNRRKEKPKIMSATAGKKIFVKGIVQGVGFRPFVYSLAVNYQLTGQVCNSSSGVEIELNGSPENLERFIHDLKNSPPPLAKIDEITLLDIEPNSFPDFKIIPSKARPGEFIPVSPDVSICPDCARELFDPADRRYRYPFINCTNCGPRFTIIKDIPYDRPFTTMAGFELCPDCYKEYENPLDRRFHAQPVACPNCGPHIWFESAGRILNKNEEALQTARLWLKEGKILAIKGLGGFHLACDASNPQAVALLRSRKRRSLKPFALMAFNSELIRKHCFISDQEKEMLESRERPIVLLRKKENSSVASDTAPNQNTLGVMLPYTPLHLLLLEPAQDFPELLVMTSGNLSEEPIAYEDPQAYEKLTDLADGFLMHNRPIHIRTDDSVVREFQGRLYPVRRSRGYAPDPLHLPKELPEILSVGAELKNTFCLTRSQYGFISHHIGDLENYETFRSFEEGILHFERLFRIKPEMIACDLHPDYLSTRYALERSEREKLPLVKIQHHHAHLASCLADNGWDKDETVLGLIFDGTGLGTDDTIWGGEFLLGNYQGYQRLFHLKNIPLPGGEAAIRKPARMAYSYLRETGSELDPELPPLQALCGDELSMLKLQLEKKINSPLTSSMGRFFDAVSALIGVRQVVSYEGQAAIELEALIDQNEMGFYEFDVNGQVIDPAPLLKNLLIDWYNGISLPILSARFHNSLVQLTRTICSDLRTTRNIQTIALSGGVWQNIYLLSNTTAYLQKDGFKVLTHQNVPASDGGLCLGQALIAAETFKK